MKKLLIILLTTLLAMSLVACGGDDDATVSGDWWIMNENSSSEGLPLFTIFKMGDNDDVASYYDLNGQELGQMDVYRDGDEITLDLGFTSATFETDGNNLYNLENGEVEFYRSDDPGFLEMLSYDGKWYRNADENATDILDISGTTYTLTTMFSEETKNFEFGPSRHIAPNGVEFNSLPIIQAEFPGPSFYPVMEGHVIYAQPFMDFECYVHEDYINDELAKMYVRFTDVMNTNWESAQDGYRLVLNINSTYFLALAYAMDENGYENSNQDLGIYVGQYSFNPSTNEVTFNYVDGGSDTFSLEDDLQEINLPTINATFTQF